MLVPVSNYVMWMVRKYVYSLMVHYFPVEADIHFSKIICSFAIAIGVIYFFDYYCLALD